MPDYIPEASAQTKITSAIQKCLDGVAGARSANQLILNPKMIVLDFIVLFSDGENSVATESLQTPEIVTDTVTDTPGTVTDTVIDTDQGRADSSTTTPSSRTTTTTRTGEDGTITDRDYEEFED